MTDSLSNLATPAPSTPSLRTLVDRLGSHPNVNRKEQAAAPEFSGLLDALSSAAAAAAAAASASASASASGSASASASGSPKDDDSAPRAGLPAAVSGTVAPLEPSSSAAAHAAARKYKTSAAQAR